MTIFPKTITEPIWRNHLKTYSHTLFEYIEHCIPLFSPDTKILSPYHLYVCPLCLQNYFAESKNGIIGNAEFSLDHLPPESVGGEFQIITCKRCNNKAGEYEAELQKLIDFGSKPDKKYGSIFPKMTVKNKETGETFHAIVQHTPGTTSISFKEEAKKYNEDLKEFLVKLHSGKLKSLELFVPSPDLQKTTKAILKSTYLLCFAWWGYEFVFSKNAEMIRQVLNDQIEYPTRIPTIWKRSKEDSVSQGISIVSKDGNREAFVVSFWLKGNNENFIASTLIPNPTEKGWEKLFELDKFVKQKELTEFQATTIPRTVIRNGYSIAWNIIFPEEQSL